MDVEELKAAADAAHKATVDAVGALIAAAMLHPTDPHIARLGRAAYDAQWAAYEAARASTDAVAEKYAQSVGELGRVLRRPSTVHPADEDLEP